MMIDLECLMDGWEKVTLTVAMDRSAYPEVVTMWWSLVFEDHMIRIDGLFYEKDVRELADDLASLAEKGDGSPSLGDWDDSQGLKLLFQCVDKERGLVAISGEFNRTTTTGGYGDTDQAYPGFTDGQGLIIQFAGPITEKANVARLASELKRFLSEGGEAAGSNTA